jgi:phospholipid/cholesterol/gamma-HCH transport system ATP-binding protein
MQARNPIIEVQGLTTSLGGIKIHQQLEMSVGRGEIFGIVGGSGAGKTVLLNMLLGLARPDAGSIKVFGIDISDTTHALTIKDKWGVLFQHGALFSSLSVLQNVCVPILERSKVSTSVARQIALYKLKLVGLPESAAYKIPEELSGGMIKRVALARALAFDAELLFLDEPTSGLDPLSADAFDRLIRNLHTRLGFTVVMITHDLSTIAMCDRIGVIVDQKMISGPLDEIRRHSHPWIQSYFGGARASTWLGR